jgi:hypothetical protein
MHGYALVDPGGQKLPKSHTDGSDDGELQKKPAGQMSQRNPSIEYLPGSQGRHGGGMLGINARFLPAKNVPLAGVIGFT